MNYNPNDIFDKPFNSENQQNEIKHTNISELRTNNTGQILNIPIQNLPIETPKLSTKKTKINDKKKYDVDKNNDSDDDIQINQIDNDTSGEQLNLVYSSFYITYVFLMTTATITFIEALRTQIPDVRNILNLETCISVVAAFFYAKFVKMIEDNKNKKNTLSENKEFEQITFQEINQVRYLDWSITTPIMLLVLVLALLYNNKIRGMNFFYFIIILLLNYGMLASGYMGENEILDKTIAGIIGFIFFIAMYGFIYYYYIRPEYNFDNNIIYFSFVILWAIYGIVYYFDEKIKNIGYNILDLFAKCFVGIFFWAYYAKVFVL